MKLKSIIIAAIALIGFAGNVWAQNWAGNTISAGDYYLYNVAEGKFLSWGANYGTRATLVENAGEEVSLAVSGSDYTISFKNITTNNKQLYLSGTTPYCDGTATWKFTETSSGSKVYYISNGDNYLSAQDYSSKLTYPLVTVTDKNAAGTMAQWQLVSRADRVNELSNANNNNPIDATFYIKGADINQNFNNANAWEGDDPTFDGRTGNLEATGYCAENYWGTTASSYQTLTGLPAGKYRVSCYGFYRDGSVTDAYNAYQAGTENIKAWLYANNESSPLSSIFVGAHDSNRDGDSQLSSGSLANKWVPNGMKGAVLSFYDGVYPRITVDVIIGENENLEIGIRKTDASQKWTIWDSFRLTYYGDDLTAYAEALQAAVDAANSFIDSHVVTNAAENVIAEVINEKNKEYYTKADYNTAIDAINSVVALYDTDEFKNAYASYKTMRTNVQGLEDTDTYKYTDSGSAKSTFDSAISSANTAVEVATTTSAINTQKGNLRAAALTFISSVTAEDGNPFNLTFLASTAAADWQTASGLNAAATAPAWSVPKPDASMADFVESYTEAAGGESITGNILYQTLNGMPAGYYTVALYAAASYTPNRGSLVEQCTDGQPNITFGFAGDNSLSLPVYHRTSLTAADQVPVNLSVQLVSSGDLTFGIKKTAAGSNWHVAQIYTITYSKDPDLTILKADRDALVSEAEGVLASADASLLTEAQRSDLSSAISTANSANTFDNLTTVTLTTLPNAIQTARQQIQMVKDNRVLMIAALERFESDYNLADGTDYRRSTMSAKAWTDLLTAVNNVTTALDDISQAPNYVTLAAALIAQMDATDASLRLFKSYKAMVEGTTELNIVGSYGADGNMDTDATQETAIAALNTAFGTYANDQDEDFSVSAFLGENLDFNAVEGSQLGTVGNIYDMAGWEETYQDVTDWARLRNQNPDEDNKYAGQLYIRTNWTDKATTLTACKEKMLPVGKYRLSFSWNSDMANMTNLSQYKLGETTVELGENKNETLSYNFEVTGSAQPFDLTFGFQKTGTGNTPAQIIVDDVTLTLLRPAEDLLARDYAPTALWFDATDSKYAAAKGVEVTPTAANQIIKAAAADQFSGLTQNVIVDGICANLVLTDGSPVDVLEAFTATTATYSRSMTNSWGTIILPFALTSNEDVQFYSLKASDDENMTFSQVESVEANTPVAFQKLSGDGITITGSNVGVVATTGSQKDNTTAVGWTAEGSYTAQSITDYNGIYYIASNKFWAADGTMTVNPFRAIFRYNGSNTVKSFNICIDDTNAIDEIVNSKSEDIKWFDLSGRRVMYPQKNGIYIQNGKKIIIK